jgi:hypothetical protein
MEMPTHCRESRVLDNCDIAILTKLNELAERYGLKPYDFVATVRHDPNAPQAILCFEDPAQGNALREERYGKMLQSLGVGADGTLTAPYAQVIDALDAALEQAPRPRRF